jgi:hypothetical protein
MRNAFTSFVIGSAFDALGRVCLAWAVEHEHEHEHMRCIETADDDRISLFLLVSAW